MFNRTFTTPPSPHIYIYIYIYIYIPLTVRRNASSLFFLSSFSCSCYFGTLLRVWQAARLGVHEDSERKTCSLQPKIRTWILIRDLLKSKAISVLKQYALKGNTACGSQAPRVVYFDAK